MLAVDALLSARGQARTDRNFQLADMLLSKLLKEHGVIVNDTFHTWKTATKRELKKLPKIDTHKSVNSRSTSTYSPDSDLYVQSLEASPIETTACSLSEETIIERIAERRRAQKSRDFDHADQIRNNLKRHGVYLQDGPYREWRADGIPFGQRSSSNNNRVAAVESTTTTGGKSRSTLVLVQSKYSLDLQSLEENKFVENLIVQRSQSKAAREYDKADYIRDKLYETYDIRLDDKLGEWSVGGQFVSDEEDYDDEDSNHNNNNTEEADGYSHWSLTTSSSSSTTNNSNALSSYQQSSSSLALPSQKDEDYIQQKVNERMRAKRTQNYDLADTIRDELYANWDVTIHDKINEWSVGGEFDSGESWNYNVNHQGNVNENGTVGVPGDDKSS